jgi:hypothetical protein
MGEKGEGNGREWVDEWINVVGREECCSMKNE